MATKRASKTERPGFACTECGWTSIRWVGRCGECQSWGTVAEAGAAKAPTTAAAAVTHPAQPIGKVPAESTERWSTGVGEFDRVLGGGFVPGAVVLLSGEPGAGKSTLLLDIAGRVARRGKPVLYVTGEESAAQVRLRGDRIDAIADDLYLVAESDLATVLGHVEQLDPALIIVDSVQTIASSNVDGVAGNVSQVREVAGALTAAAKSRGTPCVLVGHVTKDGSLAGPRVLEHLVDVVCQFDGDRHSRLRLVRAVKNRFGATDEVGCFELTDGGIAGLADPSGLFVSTSARSSGSCVCLTVEGRRPLPVEIQALTVPKQRAHPRLSTSGVPAERVELIMAVLQRHTDVNIADLDVYVSTVGGVRLTEPAADLAIACALASSFHDDPLASSLAAVGEVSLSGDVRPVMAMPRRLAEARRLGFTTVVGPHDGPKSPDGLVVAHTIKDAWASASSATRDRVA